MDLGRIFGFRLRILLGIAIPLIACAWATEGHATFKCDPLLKSRRWAISSADNAPTRELVAAARTEDLVRMRQAIRDGAYIDGNDGFETPMVSATKQRGARAVQLLIQLGANILEKDPYGRSALSWAAQIGSDLLIDILSSQGMALNQPALESESPLHYAARFGHFSVVRRLLALGENIDSRGMTGQTALMEAALMNNVEIVRYLLISGADPNIESSSGRSALGSAVYARAPDLVALLIYFGARAPSQSDRKPPARRVEHSDDYYAILGVPSAANTQELRIAYRKQALRHHPDRNPDDPRAEDYFKKLGEAFAVLKNPAARAAYDLKRRKK